MKDIDKKIEEMETQVRQSLGEEEPPETEETPPVEESEETVVEDSAEEPEVEEQETEEETVVETDKCQECERLKAELETANKRIRDTQAHMHSATTDASKMRKKIGELETEKARLEGKIEALQSEPEEESQVDTIYPEVAAELKKRDAKLESFSEKIERLERENVNDAERRKVDAVNRAKAFLLKEHPDTPNVIPSEAFQSWVGNHRYRNHIAAVLDAPPTPETVGDIADILSEFKEFAAAAPAVEDPVDKAKKVATPKSQNKARQPEIKPKEGKRYSYKKLQKMSPEAFAKISDDVDKAYLEGRIDP